MSYLKSSLPPFLHDELAPAANVPIHFLLFTPPLLYILFRNTNTEYAQSRSNHMPCAFRSMALLHCRCYRHDTARSCCTYSTFVAADTLRHLTAIRDEALKHVAEEPI